MSKHTKNIQQKKKCPIYWMFGIRRMNIHNSAEMYSFPD